MSSGDSTLTFPNDNGTNSSVENTIVFIHSQSYAMAMPP
jgi:hypothetical protein